MFQGAMFVGLKLISLWMYQRVKYQDDGRDLVNGIDFMAIHVSFSLINAWMTYTCLYQSSITFARVCPYTFIDLTPENTWMICPE